MKKECFSKTPMSKALAFILSLILVIELYPITGMAAEDHQGGFDAATSSLEGGAGSTQAPQDATTIESKIAYGEGQFKESAGQEGDLESEDAIFADDGHRAASMPNNELKDEDTALASLEAQSLGAATAAAPNPFKAGIDAQCLLGLDNYEKHIECDSDGNVDYTETAKRWKTSVGCEGTKMWAGTKIQDNGYWDQYGWSFNCGWTAPDPLHTAELYGRIENGFANTPDGVVRDVVVAEGDAGLTSLDFTAVFDGSHDVYIDMFGFQYNRLRSLHIPSFVKQIECYGFHQDGTNASLSDLMFDEGIERIAGNAFADCYGLASQDLIVLPKSLKYLESSAFANSGTLTVRLDNPDVRFAYRDSADDYLGLPFDSGTTIYAYKKKSDGSDSDPYRLSQDSAGSIYTYKWLDDEANAVKVKGTVELPTGVDASDAAITFEQQGIGHALRLEADGTFAYEDAKPAMEGMLTVALPGYYERSFFCSAAKMNDTWNLGTINAAGFTKIEAKRAYPVSVVYEAGRDESGIAQMSDITTEKRLSYELKRGGSTLTQGESNDYVIQGGTLILSESLANDANALKELELAITPDDALQLSAATARYDAVFGGFQAQLVPWGDAVIECAGTFEGASHVFLFDGTGDNARCVTDALAKVSWPDGQTDPRWLFSTGKLKAGTYTVAACKPCDMSLSVSQLGSLDRIGLPFAKAEVTVADGKTTEVKLDVPDYSEQDLRNQAGIESIRVKGPSDAVVVGCETRIEVAYRLKDASNAQIKFDLAQGEYKEVSASLKDGAGTNSQSTAGQLIVQIPQGSAEGILYVTFTPTKAQVYAVPVSIQVGGVTCPAGDASFIARDAYVEVPGNCVSQNDNTATVYAEAGSEVVLSAEGQQVGMATTNSLGRAQIVFDLPSDVANALMFGDRVKLEAEKTDGQKAQVNCTYRPATQIWSFSITTDGKTQQRVTNGVESDEYLVMSHHFPRRSNAYWTFDVTVRNGGQELNADKTLIVYVTLYNGDTVAVPLACKSQTDQDIRFVGEYVDEAYLAWLKEHPDECINDSEIPDHDFFLPESYSFSNFALAYKANLDDEDYQKRVKKRARDELKERQLQYQQFWVDYWNDYTGSQEAKDIAKEAYATLGSIVDELKARDDAESEDVLAAIAEIEALMPDFMSDADALAPDPELWIASVEKPLYTGEAREAQEWTCPSDAQINSWYGDETINVNGTEQKLADLAKEQLRLLEQTIAESNAHAKAAQKQIVKEVDRRAREAGLPEPSKSGSPQKLADASLKEECGSALVISEGDHTRGAEEDSFEDGRFTGVMFLTDVQKNGKDGKTPGIYRGFSTRVSEAAPTAIEAMPRITSYTANFDESHETWDGAKKDAWWGLGSFGFGTFLDFAGQGVDWARDLTVKNIINRRLLKNMPAEEVTRFTEAYAKANLWDKELKEIADANLKMQRTKTTFGALGLISDYFSMDSAKNALIDSGNAIRLIETDIENLYQMIKYWRAYNPCDADCKRCIDALYAELDAAEKYKEYLMAEDDNNYFDVMKGCGSATANAILTVTSLYGAKSFAGGGAAGVNSFADTAGNVLSKVNVGLDLASTECHLLRAPWADAAKNAYAEATAYRKSVCKAKGGGNDDAANDGNDAGGTDGKNYRDTIDWDRFYGSKTIIDPSGMVYEAVESNPVAGATATIWRADDAFGTGAHPWDASSYDQTSPQTTGENGSFSWDVPTGFYNVKVEKDGYASAETGWLSVLPIQTGHKVALISEAAPEVTSVYCQNDKIIFEFNQYMKTESALQIGGIDAEIAVWENPEEAPDGTNLSKRLAICPLGQLEEGTCVRILLKGAQSYNGKSLGGASGWQKDVTIEKSPASLNVNFENAVCLTSGKSIEVAVHVRYADSTPVAGQRVTAQIRASDIASFDGQGEASSITDSEGKAVFSLTGDLPGFTQLTLVAENTTLVKQLDVRTTNELGQPARPIAHVEGFEFNALSPKENAAEVTCGSVLSLETSTQGAVIYYTTDDTCPCDPSGSRQLYTGPVPVNADTKFRIAAFKDGMPFDNYSERLNLSITTKSGTADSEGSGNNPSPGTQEPSSTPDMPGISPVDKDADPTRQQLNHVPSTTDGGDGSIDSASINGDASGNDPIAPSVPAKLNSTQDDPLLIVPIIVLVCLCVAFISLVIARRFKRNNR